MKRWCGFLQAPLDGETLGPLRPWRVSAELTMCLADSMYLSPVTYREPRNFEVRLFFKHTLNRKGNGNL